MRCRHHGPGLNDKPKDASQRFKGVVDSFRAQKERMSDRRDPSQIRPLIPYVLLGDGMMMVFI